MGASDFGTMRTGADGRAGFSRLSRSCEPASKTAPDGGRLDGSGDGLLAAALDGMPADLAEPLRACRLCPRACEADRLAGQRGVCGADARVRLARAALHFWEEPCISGASGSGTVFFSYCPLRCVYCQNHDIAIGDAGTEVSVRRLARIFLELAAQGARNVNLVTPTHYAPQAVAAVRLARDAGLRLPVVYNTSGYETVEAIGLLAGTVDVYLTDFKYADAATARRYSHAPDYPNVALAALDAMVAQVGKPVFEGPVDVSERDVLAGVANGADIADVPRAGKVHEDADSLHGSADAGTASGDEAENGRTVGDDDEPPRLLRGVVVRHLLLPGRLEESKRVVRTLHERYGSDILLSIMNQYTPVAHFDAFPELNQTVPAEEYEALLDFADEIGVEDYFWQEGGADSESFIPPFDRTGVEGPEL